MSSIAEVQATLSPPTQVSPVPESVVIATTNMKKRNSSNTGWVKRNIALTSKGDIVQLPAFDEEDTELSPNELLQHPDARTLLSLFLQSPRGRHHSNVKVIDRTQTSDFSINSSARCLRLRAPTPLIKDRWLSAFKYCLSRLNAVHKLRRRSPVSQSISLQITQTTEALLSTTHGSYENAHFNTSPNNIQRKRCTDSPECKEGEVVELDEVTFLQSILQRSTEIVNIVFEKGMEVVMDPPKVTVRSMQLGAAVVALAASSFGASYHLQSSQLLTHQHDLASLPAKLHVDVNAATDITTIHYTMTHIEQQSQVLGDRLLAAYGPFQPPPVGEKDSQTMLREKVTESLHILARGGELKSHPALPASLLISDEESKGAPCCNVDVSNSGELGNLQCTAYESQSDKQYTQQRLSSGQIRSLSVSDAAAERAHMAEQQQAAVAADRTLAKARKGDTKITMPAITQTRVSFDVIKEQEQAAHDAHCAVKQEYRESPLGHLEMPIAHPMQQTEEAFDRHTSALDAMQRAMKLLPQGQELKQNHWFTLLSAGGSLAAGIILLSVCMLSSDVREIVTQDLTQGGSLLAVVIGSIGLGSVVHGNIVSLITGLCGLCLTAVIVLATREKEEEDNDYMPAPHSMMETDETFPLLPAPSSLPALPSTTVIANIENTNSSTAGACNQIGKKSFIPSFPLYPNLSARHQGFIHQLEAQFPKLLEQSDYHYSSKSWRDQGVYEDVHVQEYNDCLSTLIGGDASNALQCRGYRTMPVTADKQMTQLWQTASKPDYDMMTESVKTLEHINNHVKIERQVYRGFGVATTRYIQIVAGWQRMVFDDCPDTTDFSSSYYSNPDLRHTWRYRNSRILGLYDRDTHPDQINSIAKDHLQDYASVPQPATSHDGLEYTKDGYIMLAMTVDNYKSPDPTDAPNPKHIEAKLKVGGFLIRGVKIPIIPKNKKLLSSQPYIAMPGGYAYGAEVIGLGAVDLNGSMPSFIKSQVAKRQPTSVSNAIKLQSRKDKKTGTSFIDTIDESCLHA